MHVGDILVLEGIRKICIFFMLWGLTRAMIKMFVEKERGAIAFCRTYLWDN